MVVESFNITRILADAEKSLKEDTSLSPGLRALVGTLVALVQVLVNRLGVNSRNSSKPPSQDPNRKRKAKTGKLGRKAGGQPGREGVCLQQVDNPDEVVELKIDRTELPLPDDAYYPSGRVDVRQVIEIKLNKHIVEYQAEILVGLDGSVVKAPFPSGVTQPIQYGASVKARAVYQSQSQLIPYERVCEEFEEQFGLPISPGSIANFNEEAYRRLEDFEKIAKQQLNRASTIHGDETGINVNGKRLWLHVASNRHWTFLFPHPKRGLEAMEEMEILKSYRGFFCHDHWKAYFHFQNCTHVLCNAHHLRELKYAEEQDNQSWAKRMGELLLEINKVVTDAGGYLDKKTDASYRKKYRAILAQGEKECPPPERSSEPPERKRVKKTKSRNLLERLRDFEYETLLFMTNELVPFTNNQGERDLRMSKVQQKISGCFRSFQGAKYFCRIRSYLSTCRKNGISATAALDLLFAGKLPSFIKPPPKIRREQRQKRPKL